MKDIGFTIYSLSSRAHDETLPLDAAGAVWAGDEVVVGADERQGLGFRVQGLGFRV